MLALLIFLHVFLVIILIAVILVQQPRGRGLGAFFGGGAQDLLGVRGAPTFFQKLTWGLAAFIGLLAILIAIVSKSSSPENRARITERPGISNIIPLFSEEPKGENSPLPLQEEKVKEEKK
ncbi:MAG: preprotein translocase subunit SecG [candidate division WOR-3 bacterium]